MHTALAVRRDAGRSIETITGPRSAWRFRPHYHAGDEIVTLTAGRARLRLPTGMRARRGRRNGRRPRRHRPSLRAGRCRGLGLHLRIRPAERQRPRPPRPGDRPTPGRPRDRPARPSRLLGSDAEELASACGVSAGYLARTFQRATGTGLHNFHVLMVLQKAKALLRGGAPLVDAAFDSGFCDQAHLTREFVRTYGFTPEGLLRWPGASRQAPCARSRRILIQRRRPSQVATRTARCSGPALSGARAPRSRGT